MFCLWYIDSVQWKILFSLVRVLECSSALFCHGIPWRLFLLFFNRFAVVIILFDVFYNETHINQSRMQKQNRFTLLECQSQSLNIILVIWVIIFVSLSIQLELEYVYWISSYLSWLTLTFLLFALTIYFVRDCSPQWSRVLSTNFA